MNKFRPGMTPEEQREFLTQTRLFLSKDIKRTLWSKDLYILKHGPSAQYLFVTSEELFVLGCFGRGSTVAELVPHLIMNRRCPPLKELYELVLRASEANLLNENRDEEFAPVYPPRWWPSLDHNAAHAVWWLSAIAGSLAFFFWNGTKAELPGILAIPGWGWPAAWLVLALCASFGSLLASAYVHRSGGEVQRPRLLWKTLLPRIAFDWTDGVMNGPSSALQVARLRVIPFLLLAFLCFAIPALKPFAAIAVAGLLWRIAPYPGGPLIQWMESRYREPLRSVSRSRLFYHGPRSFASKMLEELKATDWSFALIMAAYATVWSALVIWFLGVVFNGKPFEAFRAVFDEESNLVLQYFGLATGILAVFVLGSLVYGWYRMKRDESAYGRVPVESHKETSATVSETFDESMLFRELSVDIRTELAKHARVVTVVAGARVVSGEDRGENLYMVQSGEFEILTPHAKGRGEVVARLKRGDVFGELAFFGELFRPRNIRARGTGTLIAVNAPELEQTLKRYLSVPAIEEIVQKRTFLRRIPLSCGWLPGSIVRFAKCSRFESMKEGQSVVFAGRENRFFYLVQEGELEVRHRGRRRARIRGGDFFGEISLMLNTPATADIVASAATRCLVLQKSDFLTLMGQDIELALQMERIASLRFGRPVFPFQGASIEGLAN